MRSKSVVGGSLLVSSLTTFPVKHSLNSPETIFSKQLLIICRQKEAFAEDPYNLWVYNDRSKVSDRLIYSWRCLSCPIIQDSLPRYEE